ncbi:hypothetical protein ACFQDD_13330 [Halorubrum pallidum]|uniref:Uncharacterized protein n=1 Tax=Halorubrum pallidum TaxID=1526114 RepID=A0ABD5T9P7_9EURY
MTVISRAEARRSKRYDEVKHLIPDAEARAGAMCEDLQHPAEREAHGIEDIEDAVAVVLEETKQKIRDAPVPADAQTFVDDEIDRAEAVVPEIVRHADLGVE